MTVNYAVHQTRQQPRAGERGVRPAVWFSMRRRVGPDQTPRVLLQLLFFASIWVGARAKLIDVSFGAMADASSIIVVGQVRDLSQDHDRTIATADVLDILRGPAGTRQIKFVASRTYAEDFSGTNRGEIAMLFLANSCGPGTSSTRWYTEGAPTNVASTGDLCIAAQGRGRFLRKQVDGDVHWLPVSGLITYPPSLLAVTTTDEHGAWLLPDRPFRKAIQSAIAGRSN